MQTLFSRFKQSGNPDGDESGPVRRKANHIVPWIWLNTVLVFFLRLQADTANWMLFMAAVYALADIVKSEGDYDTLFYWCIYACVVSALLLVLKAVCKAWVMVLLYGCAIIALLLVAYSIWKKV